MDTQMQWGVLLFLLLFLQIIIVLQCLQFIGVHYSYCKVRGINPHPLCTTLPLKGRGMGYSPRTTQNLWWYTPLGEFSAYVARSIDPK